MKKNHTDMLALAGLLHDVGKFAERAGMDLPAGYESDNAALYQPVNSHKHYTHKHALYSAAFIEKFSDLIPRFSPVADIRAGDSLINLAAMHHKPETPLQWIIAMADRLSSGLDRQVFEGEETGVAFKDFRKTRLIPIAEQLLRGNEFYRGDSPETYLRRYRLAELTPEQVFPCDREQAEPRDDATAKAEYQALFAKFTEALANLDHRETPTLWLDHFTTLWERFTSAIPAATVGKVIPDVSLFDHGRATAALAAALYLYHDATGSLTESAIKDGSLPKFLLITGDFYGIQNFIFAEGGSTNRAAAKILRGRSFCVSLLAELAAETLCRELDLPTSAVLLNAAGKFTLLAPDLSQAREVVQRVEAELNQWLITHFFAETAIGFSMISATGDDFSKGQFPNLWEELAKASEARKCRKIDLAAHAGVVSGYLDRFDNRLSPALCPFCGKRPADMATRGKPLLGQNEAACRICYDHIQTGFYLIRAENLAIVDATASYSGNSLMEPLYGRYQLAFDLSGTQSTQLLKSGHLVALREIVNAGEMPKGRHATRPISGYVPVYREQDEKDIDRLLHGRKSDRTKNELFDMVKEGGAKSFHHIAKGALLPRMGEAGKFAGTEALGVLKADVDNLGKLFACGLPAERLNLSRLATFSRQMNSFFALFLPNLLATDPRFNDIYTVFAGGDDLFLIGPWNRVIELASVLHDAFNRFGCENPQITISAGISVNKPGVPVPALAEQAETGLGAAKAGGRNAITVFGATVKWGAFTKLREIRDILQDWQGQGFLGKGMLYQLNELQALAAREQLLRTRKKTIDLKDMDCLAWRSKLVYSATRNVGKALDKESRKAAVDEVLKVSGWLQEHEGKFKIALWQVLYNQR